MADRPDISTCFSRDSLQRLLADSLSPGTIVLNKKLVDCRDDEAGGMRLMFADGTEEIVDLVVYQTHNRDVAFRKKLTLQPPGDWCRWYTLVGQEDYVSRAWEGS